MDCIRKCNVKMNILYIYMNRNRTVGREHFSHSAVFGNHFYFQSAFKSAKMISKVLSSYQLRFITGITTPKVISKNWRLEVVMKFS